MRKIHNHITNIAMLNDSPLTRWLLAIVILLPKYAGNRRFIVYVSSSHTKMTTTSSLDFSDQKKECIERIKNPLGDNQT